MEGIDEEVTAALDAVVRKLEERAKREVVKDVTQWSKAWINAHRSPATQLSMTITEGDKTMSVALTVDDANDLVTFQFSDDHGDAEEGPLDSVTGAPVAPSASSDTTTVATVGTATETTPGSGTWTAPITLVAEGTANITADPLSNSDGSPVLETAGPNEGQPFSVPSPVNITVGPGPVEGLAMSVTQGS